MGFLSTLLSPRAGAVTASELRGPVAWLLDVGHEGRKTTAGVSISEGSMLTLGAVFAAVRAISEDVAKLPLKLYRRTEPRGKDVARDDPLYRLVHTEPNPEMGAFDFKQALIANALMWHGGYAEVERSGGGEPVALWPVHGSRVAVRRDADGVLYYEVRDGQPGETRDVPARDMLHVKGFGDTGLVGFLIAHHAKESFGIYMAAEQFAGSFFGNGASPRAAVSFEGKVDPAAGKAYIEGIRAKYGGASKAHDWLVFDHGAKVTPLSWDAQKAQMVESLQFRIEDVARWFRVPPHKLGHLLRATFSNIEHQGLEYLQDTIAPWLVRVEQEFDRKLLPRDERERFFEHVRDAILQADTASRFASYQVAITNGIMSPNEARDKENLNPYPGGDSFLVPQNMATVLPDGTTRPNNAAEGNAQDAPPPPPDAEAAKAAMMPVFVDAAERMIAREAKAIAAKGGNATEEWLGRFYAGHEAEVARAFAPPIATLARLAGTEPGDLAERYAAEHVAESRQQLAAGCDPQDWLAERPAWIAEHLTDLTAPTQETDDE